MRKGVFLFAWFLLFVLPFRAAPAAEVKGGGYLVYIGTYTGAKSKGIYACQLDTKSGSLASLGLAIETPSPSFLAIAPNQKFLYAANELDQFSGKRGGAVSSFSIDSGSGKLRLLNQRPSGGAGPCHVSVDHSG